MEVQLSEAHINKKPFHHWFPDWMVFREHIYILDDKERNVSLRLLLCLESNQVPRKLRLRVLRTNFDIREQTRPPSQLSLTCVVQVTLVSGSCLDLNSTECADSGFLSLNDTWCLFIYNDSVSWFLARERCAKLDAQLLEVR